MNRRAFLGAMLAACAAPAIVRAGSLMRINPRIIVYGKNTIEQFRQELAIAHAIDLDKVVFFGSQCYAWGQLGLEPNEVACLSKLEDFNALDINSIREEYEKLHIYNLGNDGSDGLVSSYFDTERK